MTRTLFEKLTLIMSWAASFILIIAVVILIGFLIKKGITAINLKLIFGDVSPVDAILLRKQVFDGLFPAIIGTFILISCSIVIAVPIGIATGIYMAEYAKGKFKAIFTLLFDVLAAIPSIVVGLAGLSLTIYLHKLFPNRVGPSVFISACSLALLVLPYLIRSTQSALEGIDPIIRITAPSLGASRLQNVIKVLIPNAMSDIVGGVILAVGRCAEDTAVIMLTGAVAVAGIPKTIFNQYEALPFYIYYISSQYTTPQELASGYGAAILLLLLCVTLLIFALWIQKRLTILLLYQ